MNELELKKRLYTKVETLAQSIGKLQKQGQNSFSRYKYITHEQVSTAVRSESIHHQVSIVADMVDYKETALPVDNKGRIGCRTVVKMVFTITDLETGHQEQHTFFGAEQDTGGKSMQQAVSQCNKYFLFKLLKITDKGEDADAVTNEVTPAPVAETAPVKNELPKLSLDAAKQALNECKTVDSLNQLYLKWSQTMQMPRGIVKACKERKAAINKTVKKWTYQSESKPGTSYTTTVSKDGWACTCPQHSIKNKECKHIKLSKPLS